MYRSLIAIAFALIAFGAWAVSNPITSPPDDDFNLSSVWCATTADDDLCTRDASITASIVPVGVTWPCFMHQERTSAACRSSDPRIRPDSDERIAVWRENGNWGFDYPTRYHETMGVLASEDTDRSAYLMRFVNIVLALGLLTAIAVTASRGLRQALLLAWFVLLLPTTIYFVGSNNLSSWALIGIGTFWAAILGLAYATSRRNAAINAAAALLAALMAGARYDSTTYMVVVGVATIAFLLIRWNQTRYPLEASVAAGVAIVLSALHYLGRGDGLVPDGNLPALAVTMAIVALGVGVWLLLRRLPPRVAPRTAIGALAGLGAFAAFLGVVAALIGSSGFGAAPDLGGSNVLPAEALGASASTADKLVAYLWNLPPLLLGNFGSYPLGWLDLAMPGAVPVIGLLIAGGVTFHMLRTADWRSAVIGAGVATAAVAVVLYTEISTGLTPIDWQLQPRYFLPLFFPSLGLVFLRHDVRQVASASLLQRWVFIVAATSVFAIALHAMIRRYTTGITPFGLEMDRNYWDYWPTVAFDLRGIDLSRDVAWWYFPLAGPMTTWVIGTLAFLGLLIALRSVLFPTDTDVIEQELADSAPPNE